jgi:hypothetical protein
MKQNKNSLHFIINGKQHESYLQYITGADIRQLGNIPNEDEIFLQIKEPWKDEPVENDTKVDLARPGLEHFFSKIKLPVTIIVNTRPTPWNEEKISYDQVVTAAFPKYVHNDATAFTVTYERGPKQNQEGTIVKGDSVFVKNKMNFVVTETGKS